LPLAREWEACFSQTLEAMVSEEPTMNDVLKSALPVLLSLEVLRSFFFFKIPLKNIAQRFLVYLLVCLPVCFLVSLLCLFLLLSSYMSPCPSPFQIPEVSRSLRKVSQRGCLDWANSGCTDVIILWKI